MPLLVQVSLCYLPIGGGQEVYIRNLSDAIRSAGWDSKVVQPYRGARSLETICVPRIPWVQRHLHWFDEAQFAFFAAVFASRWLDRADVILCHYATTARMLARNRAWRRKTIVLSHGVEWNVDRMNRHDRKREENAKKMFGQLTTVANDTDYLRRVGLPARPAHAYYQPVTPSTWFIPNAVDCSLFRPDATCQQPVERCDILVPRQICEDRGIYLAIQAFILLARQRPNLHMHIVGPVREKEYYDRCLRLVDKEGVANRVLFRTAVPNGEMPAVYRKARITVIPTLRREGTSLSALESMACGTPVVATGVAGLLDLPAVFCEPKPESMATAMGLALDAHDHLAAQQLEAVQTIFSKTIWTEAWIRVLNTVRQNGVTPLEQ